MHGMHWRVHGLCQECCACTASAPGAASSVEPPQPSLCFKLVQSEAEPYLQVECGRSANVWLQCKRNSKAKGSLRERNKSGLLGTPHI